jgi:hypothetical protein
MGLIKIFSGEEILAVTLKERLEEANIDVVLRSNNQANVLPSIQTAKANPVSEAFRLTI